MYKITEKVALNPAVTKMVIEAPLIAKRQSPASLSLCARLKTASASPHRRRL